VAITNLHCLTSRRTPQAPANKPTGEIIQSGKGVAEFRRKIGVVAARCEDYGQQTATQRGDVLRGAAVGGLEERGKGGR
jgi:hypothetical protein